MVPVLQQICSISAGEGIEVALSRCPACGARCRSSWPDRPESSLSWSGSALIGARDRHHWPVRDEPGRLRPPSLEPRIHDGLADTQEQVLAGRPPCYRVGAEPEPTATVAGLFSRCHRDAARPVNAVNDFWLGRRGRLDDVTVVPLGDAVGQGLALVAVRRLLGQVVQEPLDVLPAVRQFPAQADRLDPVAQVGPARQRPGVPVQQLGGLCRR